MSTVSPTNPGMELPAKISEAEVRAALTQLRKKLLDLTARNPLISFKQVAQCLFCKISD